MPKKTKPNTIKKLSNGGQLDTSAGFGWCLQYNDGHGSANGVHLSGESHTAHLHIDASAGGLGYSYTYDRNAIYDALVRGTKRSGAKADTTNAAAAADSSQPLLREGLQESVKKVAEDFHTYRADIIANRKGEQNVLSDRFWADVYDNPDLSYDELWTKLETMGGVVEGQPNTFQTMLAQYSDAFMFVFARLEFCHKSPQHCWWFVFWDEVWTNNHQMDDFQTRAAVQALCPLVPTSLCYTMLSQDELEARLRELQLFHESNEDDQRLFFPSLLDKMYAAKAQAKWEVAWGWMAGI